MKFPRKREAVSVEQTAADFFTVTRDLLRKAHGERHEPSLRRAALRIDSVKFNELDDDHQERLLVLYSSAMAACGAFLP